MFNKDKDVESLGRAVGYRPCKERMGEITVEG